MGAEDKMKIPAIKLGFKSIPDFLYKKNQVNQAKEGAFQAYVQLPGLLNGSVEPPKNA